MLGWSFSFLIGAIVVGLVGFSDVDQSIQSVAQIVFWLLLALALVAAALGVLVPKERERDDRQSAD